MTNDVFGDPWLGGLFGDDQTAKLLGPEQQLGHFIRIEAAYSRALGAAGTVPSDVSEAAAKHIESVTLDMEGIRAGTERDGVPIPELVRQLKQDAAPKLHPAIHAGMTSQDVVDTALVLSLKDVISLYETRLSQINNSLRGLAKQHGDVKITGRTRMQSAKPIKVSDRLSTWIDPIEFYVERLLQIKPLLLKTQLGGAVGNRNELGSFAPQIAKTFASLLGLENAPSGWHTQRASIVEFANWLALVTGSLGKMGQDIVLMSQQGVDEIGLSGGGGSSAMPHKHNPILAELLVTLARFNATQISGMHQTMIHEQERSGSAWALEWMLLPQMVLATSRSMTAAQNLCEQIVKIGQSQ